MDLPDLTLLGYSDRRPRLRMIHLADRSVEAAPTTLDDSTGYSCMTLRDGWIAVDCLWELWCVPLPMTEPVRLLASGSVDCVPSLDPANFWIGATSRVSGARVLVEIDRNGRAVADPIPVADGTRLEAVTPLGLVIDSEDTGVQLLERGDGSPEPIAGLSGDWEVVGVHDSTIVVQRRLFELAIVDLRHGTILAVERPGEGAWGSHAAFSPDGTTIAIDARPDPPPPLRPFAEAIGAEAPLERAWLAFIDVASGATTVCRGEFAVHSYMPVWSRDGRWIVFASPFEKRQIWLVARDDPELRRVSFRRQPPMPMLDLSDQ